MDLKVKPATTLKESLGVNVVHVVRYLDLNLPLFNRDSIPPKHKHVLASTLGVAEDKGEANSICAYLRCLSQTLHKAELMGYGEQEGYEFICSESAEADRGLCDSTRTSRFRVWRARG